MRVKVSFINRDLQKIGGYTRTVERLEELYNELYKKDVYKLKKEGYVLTPNYKGANHYLVCCQII